MSQAATDSAPAANPDNARKAGRGVLSIAGSKLYFLLAGYAAQLLLPRLLASPEVFGLFSTAMSFVSILNNVLISATIQVVSKRVSEDLPRSTHTLRQALELQLVVGCALGGCMLLSAPLLAESFLLDPLLTPLFRLSAVVVLCYAVYAAMIGALNGRQNFAGQARFDMGYMTLRTGMMLGAAALGLGASGVFVGFALSSVLVLITATLVVGIGQSGTRMPWRRWLSFMAPLWLYQLCLNLILQVDVALLKRTVAELLLTGGSSAAAAAEVASRYVGFYRAAQTFAFVPYQLILSVPLVIFPLVSQALSLGDETTARRYIYSALRYSLLILLAVAAPFAGAAPAVMRLAYPAAYVAGAPALAVLVLSMVCFALFVIAATIMTAAGRPGLAAGVALVSVGMVFLGNIGLVRFVGVGPHTLLAAASGTGLGTVLGLAVIGATMYRRFNTFIAPLTIARSAIAAVTAFAVSRALLTDSRLASIGALAAGAVAYGVALWLLRELTRVDFDAALGMLRRKR
jgi:stage V sporulation protein B